MITITREQLLSIVKDIDHLYQFDTEINTKGQQWLDRNWESLQSGEFFEEPEEKTIPFTKAHLVRKLGWNKFCEITGIDYWCESERGVIEDEEIFRIKQSVAHSLDL
jgi:hypothetical protein